MAPPPASLPLTQRLMALAQTLQCEYLPSKDSLNANISASCVVCRVCLASPLVRGRVRPCAAAFDLQRFHSSMILTVAVQTSNPSLLHLTIWPVVHHLQLLLRMGQVLLSHGFRLRCLNVRHCGLQGVPGPRQSWCSRRTSSQHPVNYLR